MDVYTHIHNISLCMSYANIFIQKPCSIQVLKGKKVFSGKLTKTKPRSFLKITHLERQVSYFFRQLETPKTSNPVALKNRAPTAFQALEFENNLPPSTSNV